MNHPAKDRFSTKRTLVRSFVESDLNALYEMMADQDVMRFTGFKTAQKKSKVSSLLQKWIKEGQSHLGVWAAIEKDTSEFIGWFMLKKTITDSPELGFMLTKKFWGKGFATEIAEGFFDYGRNINIKRIIASTVSENSASIRVLDKIGMNRCAGLSSEELLYFERKIEQDCCQQSELA